MKHVQRNLVQNSFYRFRIHGTYYFIALFKLYTSTILRVYKSQAIVFLYLFVAVTLGNFGICVRNVSTKVHETRDDRDVMYVLVLWAACKTCRAYIKWWDQRHSTSAQHPERTGLRESGFCFVRDRYIDKQLYFSVPATLQNNCARRCRLNISPLLWSEYIMFMLSACLRSIIFVFLFLF